MFLCFQYYFVLNKDYSPVEAALSWKWFFRLHCIY